MDHSGESAPLQLPALRERKQLQGLGRSTSLLDLSDDTLGIIYSKLYEKSERAAFRHSCSVLHRSKSIDSRIKSLRIECLLPEDLKEHVQMLLEAFPRNATLSTLILNTGEMTAAAFYHVMHKAEAAKVRLATVSHFELQFSQFDGACSAELPFLLPRLQQAKFFSCRMYANCLRMGQDVPEFQLRSLCLQRCSFHECLVSLVCEGRRSEPLAGLSALKSLETLHVLSPEMSPEIGYQELPLSQLVELQSLTSLRLADCNPVGLDDLLQSVKTLREVHCFSILPPPGIQLVSNSLQVLTIMALSLPFLSALPPGCLPALRALEMQHLDLSDAAADGMIDSIYRLAEFPLRAMSGFDLELLGNSSWSFAQSMSVLQALSCALKDKEESLGTVDAVLLSDWPMGPGFMRVFSKAFPNIQFLDTYRHRSPPWNVYSEGNSGLVDAVLGIKSLRRIDVDLTGCSRVPMDCVKTLLLAQQCHRPFLLCLRVPPALHAAASAVCDQFQVIKADHADWEVDFDLDLYDEESEPTD